MGGLGPARCRCCKKPVGAGLRCECWLRDLARQTALAAHVARPKQGLGERLARAWRLHCAR